MAAGRREHELAVRGHGHRAGDAAAEQRREAVAERERELIVELEAVEVADLAVAIDQPAVRAIEHAQLVQEAELDLLAALAARRRPQIDRAVQAALVVRAAHVHRAERREPRATADRIGPRIEQWRARPDR